MKIELELPDTITFNIGDRAYPIPTADIPAVSLAAMTVYGKRKLGDAVHAAMHAQDADGYKGERVSLPARVDAWLSNLKAGTLPDGGGGGSRLSELEKEMRTIVHNLLVNGCGYKSAQAAKVTSKGADFAFATMGREMGTDDDKIAVAWDKFIDHAAKVIETRRSGPDLSEMLADKS